MARDDAHAPNRLLFDARADPALGCWLATVSRGRGRGPIPGGPRSMPDAQRATRPSPRSDRASGPVIEARRYIVGTNMTWAFGVPGNISHGSPGVGLLEIPVVCVVANGM